MYHRVSDFLKSWEHHRSGTQRIMDALTPESLDLGVTEGHRDLRRLAWHIVTSIGEMAGRTGLKIAGPHHESAPPTGVEEIRSAYRAVSTSLAEEVKKQWNDAALEKSDDMYGEQWQRGTTLMIVQLHEAHHRGQMTVLMRQAGIKVPGVYGPAKEDWSQYGMEPPTV